MTGMSIDHMSPLNPFLTPAPRLDSQRSLVLRHRRQHSREAAVNSYRKGDLKKGLTKKFPPSFRRFGQPMPNRCPDN